MVFSRFSFSLYFYQRTVALWLAVDENNVILSEEQVRVIGNTIRNLRIFYDSFHEISPSVHMPLYGFGFFGFFFGHDQFFKNAALYVCQFKRMS